MQSPDLWGNCREPLRWTIRSAWKANCGTERQVRDTARRYAQTSSPRILAGPAPKHSNARSSRDGGDRDAWFNAPERLAARELARAYG